jgi:hypothetical protein
MEEQFWCVLSQMVNLPQKTKDVRKKYTGCKTCNFAPINILRVTLERAAETRAGLHVRCPLTLFGFNQN